MTIRCGFGTWRAAKASARSKATAGRCRGRHHAGRSPCGLGVRGQHAAGLGPGERAKPPHARRPQPFGDRGRHHAGRSPCGLGVRGQYAAGLGPGERPKRPHARRPQQFGERGRHHAGRTPCGLGVRGQHAAGLGPGERPKRPHARRPQQFGERGRYHAGRTPCGLGVLDKTLRVWDLESGKELALLTADGLTASCAVSLDGRTIVAGDATGNIHILKMEGFGPDQRNHQRKR